MDFGVSSMDPIASFLLLFIFLAGLMGLLFTSKRSSWNGTLSNVQIPDVDLNTFARKGPSDKSNRRGYIFSEEHIVSMTHRYNGRIDSAILRWNTGPILDRLIERKFPRKYLPDNAKQEDMFQSSLYSMALKEKGISTSTAKLVIIYCLQDIAIACLTRESSLNCIYCRKGKVFTTRLNEKKTLKTLARLDEVWYAGRKPKPFPSNLNCRSCPFSKNQKCDFRAK